MTDHDVRALIADGRGLLARHSGWSARSDELQQHHRWNGENLTTLLDALESVLAESDRLAKERDEARAEVERMSKFEAAVCRTALDLGTANQRIHQLEALFADLRTPMNEDRINAVLDGRK